MGETGRDQTRLRPGSSGDERLVARLAAGDESALADVYGELGSYVFGLARRVTVNVTAAEEVVQEVFLRLWTHPHLIDLDRGSLRSYCGVLTHRRAVDLIRREERRTAREFKVAADDDHEVVAVEGAVVELMSAARVREAVSSLPPDQRDAVELAYFEGLSYREVGVRLGIPEGTAKSRLRLALAKLAGMLDDLSDTGDPGPR